jgi:hypothetical protein
MLSQASHIHQFPKCLLSVVTLKCRNFHQDQTCKNKLQHIYFRYKNKTKKMHTYVSDYLILYYIRNILCLPHVSVTLVVILREVSYKEYITNLHKPMTPHKGWSQKWPKPVQIWGLLGLLYNIFCNFCMKLSVLSLYWIILMHCHGFFKIDISPWS